MCSVPFTRYRDVRGNKVSVGVITTGGGKYYGGFTINFTKMAPS